MDGALFSSCCLFGPRHPSTGACGLLGGAILNAKMVTCWSSHTFEYFLGATSDLAPHSRPLPTPNFLRDPQRSSDRLAHSPMKSLLCLQSQSMWNFVAALQDWSLYFSQSCEAPELKPYWPLKPNGLEAWCGAQNSLLWENLCNLIIFQFLGHSHLVGMRYYIATVPLLSCCGFCFIFDIENLFSPCSRLFWSMIVQ